MSVVVPDINQSEMEAQLASKNDALKRSEARAVQKEQLDLQDVFVELGVFCKRLESVQEILCRACRHC